MFQNYFLKLNCNVNLSELSDYYNILDTEHQDLRWTWEKNGFEIKELWRQRMLSEEGTLLQTGWAIQSNLVDISIPCPPYNVSIHETCEYRNTKLAFGIIERLQKLMPYTYRWSLVVQPPNGKVAKHVDQGDEYTAHIPIQWDSEAVFVCGENEDTVVTFPPTGEIYILNTIIPHYTENRSNNDRIGIVFRFNQSDLPKLLELTGTL